MAEVTPREVIKTRTIEEKYTAVDGVILELTHEETAVLMFLIGHRVSGGGKSKGRKLLDGIYHKLGAMGYQFRGKHYNDVTKYEGAVTADSMIIFNNPEGEF